MYAFSMFLLQGGLVGQADSGSMQKLLTYFTYLFSEGARNPATNLYAETNTVYLLRNSKGFGIQYPLN